MDADLQDYPMASSKKGTPEGNAIFFAKPVESLSRKSSDRGSIPLGSTSRHCPFGYMPKKPVVTGFFYTFWEKGMKFYDHGYLQENKEFESKYARRTDGKRNCKKQG